MATFIKFFSNTQGEIYKFLKHFYSSKDLPCDYNFLLEYEEHFENPIEMSDMIGVFAENIDDYKMNMWVSLDKDILINVTKNNADDLIRYLYERFPY